MWYERNKINALQSMLLIFKPVMLLSVTCLGWSQAVVDHSVRLLRRQRCLETDLLDQALVLRSWAHSRGTKVAATVVQKGVTLAQKGCKDKLLCGVGSFANM